MVCSLHHLFLSIHNSSDSLFSKQVPTILQHCSISPWENSGLPHKIFCGSIVITVILQPAFCLVFTRVFSELLSHFLIFSRVFHYFPLRQSQTVLTDKDNPHLYHPRNGTRLFLQTSHRKSYHVSEPEIPFFLSILLSYRFSS